MRKILLKTALLIICFVFIQGRALAVYTFNWNGSASTDWTNTSNWTVTGTGSGTASYPGSNSRTTDIVQLGVTGSTAYSRQPILTLASTDSLVLGSVIFGSVQYSTTSPISGYTITGTVLTVNAGKLVVSGDITQNINTNSGSIFNVLTGTGTISCNNIQMGTPGDASSGNKVSILISLITGLSVKTDVKINLNVNAATGVGFRLESGTMTVGGKITFIDNAAVTVANASYFTVNAKRTQISTTVATNPTLILNNAAAIGSFSGTATGVSGSLTSSINFYGDHGGDATTIYRGASPLIYTTATKGFGPGGGKINDNVTTDAIYDNLIIQGNGTAVIGGATATAFTSYLNIESSLTTNSNTSFLNGTNTITTIGAANTTAAIWTNNSTSTITGGTGTIDINGSLTNSGIMNMGTGNLTISKDYNNTGTFTPNSSALITFDGTTTQNLTDKIKGTTFKNVNFTNGGTKTMVADSKFAVAPTYTLNVLGSSTLAVGNTTATPTSLTIQSTLAGDASIGNLSAGTITGNINVQRYVRGNLRRYMLLSYPVNNTIVGISVVNNAYNLNSLRDSTYMTGPGGSTNGFDNSPTTGNSPSVFIYDENAPVSANVNLVVGNEYKQFSSTSQGVPMGNGFVFYFRGNRRTVSNPFVRPFPAAKEATLLFFGSIFKSILTNGAFAASIINFPATPPNDYTASAVTFGNLSYHNYNGATAGIKQGLNLIGNPYPSAIDLKQLYNINKAAFATNLYKFYYMLIMDSSTGSNSSSTKFAVYDATSTATTPPAGTSQFALSGQGFFTLATAASSFIFDETIKVPYSSYSGAPSTSPVFNVKPNPNPVLAKLAVGKHENSIQQITASNQLGADDMPRLRLELVKDSVIHNSTDINFDKTASNKFVPGEDAPYFKPAGQGDILYSVTTDSVGCFANYIGNLEKIKRVNLSVDFSNYGLYKITSPYKANIDERYTIFLKDNYTNDSLDVVHNAEYAFNIDKNAASYAHDRFYLSIGIAPGHDYKLLDFSGSRVTTGIQLTWKTDNESNFTRFVVEKSTDGGKLFTAIDSLQSTGTGNYTFIDHASGSGQVIYRLKQYLVTGAADISKNLTFNYLTNNSLKFIIYPSNTTQNININFGKVYNNLVTINIISSTGSLVKTVNANNTGLIQQDVGSLLKGLYIVEATDEATGKRIGSAKFFKE